MNIIILSGVGEMTNQEIAVEIVMLAHNRNREYVDPDMVTVEILDEGQKITYNMGEGITIVIEYYPLYDWIMATCLTSEGGHVWGIYAVSKVVELFRKLK
jgi:hypothetical protein